MVEAVIRLGHRRTDGQTRYLINLYKDFKYKNLFVLVQWLSSQGKNAVYEIILPILIKNTLDIKHAFSFLFSFYYKYFSLPINNKRDRSRREFKPPCIVIYFCSCNQNWSRSQWPRGLRRGCVATRFLGLWVWIPPGVWMYVSCECCVSSGRGLCVGLITRPEESYRVWCVWVWSWILDNEEALTHWGGGHCAMVKKKQLKLPRNIQGNIPYRTLKYLCRDFGVDRRAKTTSL
jgi:hypothetical protein